MKVDTVKELSAKVRHDTITIYLLKAQNRRLKKLEEANRRLRKYNGELRHALIKEQAEDPVIQIPDGGHDGGQLFSNESVKEVSQTLQDGDAVAFNSVVMDLVFKKLDMKTIKKCRLTCKNWNETVSRILSRQNGGYGLAVRLEEGKLNGMSNACGQHTIEGLKSVVAAAPQNWFSKALLDNNFTRRTEIQSVLLDFGYRLRSIEITEYYFLFQDLHKLLVDWCPNLEQLALPPDLDQDGDVGDDWGELEEGYQNLVFTQPLKLTSLFMQNQLWASIVKASPNLKTLRCDSGMDSFQFFEELLTCPEITRNLEDVTVLDMWEETRQSQTIEVFNSIEFSSKLKKLAIHANGHSQANQLTSTLKKSDETLEKLVLFVTKSPHSLPNDPQLVFPEMNNLTELRYLTCHFIPITSIDFLTCMPNLKTLYLGGFYNEAYTIGFDSRDCFVDNLFSDCGQLRRKPLKKLKEFYLFGGVRSPSPTFKMMNHIFPNLTKLVVGISKWSRYDDLHEVNEVVFNGGISEMTNLKELYLDFRSWRWDCCEWDYWEEKVDYLPVALGHSKTLSNLNHLTIRVDSDSNTTIAGEKLVEIPNLQRVTVVGLKVKPLAVMELTLLLYKHNIHLEIKDNDVREEFRVHLEERHTPRNFVSDSAVWRL